MPSKSKVYLAGVGCTPSKGDAAAQVSAITKALLDAGLTYDQVTRSVSSEGAQAFKAFEEGGPNVDEAGRASLLSDAFTLVHEKGEQCVTVLGMDKSTTIAFVLISEDFIWRHPYLKDDAALLTKSGQQESGKEPSLNELCNSVWILRGWKKSDHADKKDARLSISDFELSRADSKSVPDWKSVEHKQDGKHRLGYNPATVTKEISHEDFEAVRAEKKSKGGGDLKKLQERFKRKGGDRAALAKL